MSHCASPMEKEACHVRLCMSLVRHAWDQTVPYTQFPMLLRPCKLLFVVLKNHTPIHRKVVCPLVNWTQASSFLHSVCQSTNYIWAHNYLQLRLTASYSLGWECGSPWKTTTPPHPFFHGSHQYALIHHYCVQSYWLWILNVDLPFFVTILSDLISDSIWWSI